MGIRSFVRSTRRLLYVASRPSGDELKLLIKVSLLGVLLIGAIGFMIRVIAWIFNLYQFPGV